MATEQKVQLTITRGVSLGGGVDVFAGAEIEVSPKEATWLLAGEFAIPGWGHPEYRTLDEGLANREGATPATGEGKKGK